MLFSQGSRTRCEQDFSLNLDDVWNIDLLESLWCETTYCNTDLSYMTTLFQQGVNCISVWDWTLTRDHLITTEWTVLLRSRDQGVFCSYMILKIWADCYSLCLYTLTTKQPKLECFVKPLTIFCFILSNPWWNHTMFQEIWAH